MVEICRRSTEIIKVLMKGKWSRNPWDLGINNHPEIRVRFSSKESNMASENSPVSSRCLFPPAIDHIDRKQFPSQKNLHVSTMAEMILKPSPRSGDFRAPTAFRGAEKWMVDVVLWYATWFSSVTRGAEKYGTKQMAGVSHLCWKWLEPLRVGTHPFQLAETFQNHPTVCKALKHVWCCGWILPIVFQSNIGKHTNICVCQLKHLKHVSSSWRNDVIVLMWFSVCPSPKVRRMRLSCERDGSTTSGSLCPP